MHILNLLPLVPLFIMAHLTVANPAPAPIPAPASAPDAIPAPVSDLDNPLFKRACTYNGCVCRDGVKPGLYCWGCNAHSNAGTEFAGSGDYRAWVLQCGEKGACCVYGPMNSCANGARNPCG